MKRVIQLGMIWLILIALGGCSMMNKQEESNIALSAEHEALCNSKNTLNKKLCRQTMGQLPKFETDINTYFKEKFNIDGFKLTGIHFPYDGFNRGGFNATFQLESDPYVMITDTFDYRDGKYMIQPSTNESSEVAGENTVANAILFSSYYKEISISQIEEDLEKIGIKVEPNHELYYFYNSGRSFFKKNLVSDFFNSGIKLSNKEQLDIINVYKNKNQGSEIFENYRSQVEKTLKIFPMTVAGNQEEAEYLFKKYIEYRTQNAEYTVFLAPEMIYYENMSSRIKEKSISMYNEGEVIINE